jgi:hypothetical protein
MIRLNILPECYIDTQVASILTQAKLNHQMGCSQVANKLSAEFRNAVALGIIDEDKNKGSVHPYLKEFNIQLSVENLLLKKHNTREHYLIVICPEIENWLLNDAQSSNINLTDYELPIDLKSFKGITKTQNINTDQKLYRFIKALIRKEAPSITTLKKWLELFNANQLNKLTT